MINNARVPTPIFVYLSPISRVSQDSLEYVTIILLGKSSPNSSSSNYWCNLQNCAYSIQLNQMVLSWPNLLVIPLNFDHD